MKQVCEGERVVCLGSVCAAAKTQTQQLTKDIQGLMRRVMAIGFLTYLAVYCSFIDLMHSSDTCDHCKHNFRLLRVLWGLGVRVFVVRRLCYRKYCTFLSKILILQVKDLTTSV